MIQFARFVAFCAFGAGALLFAAMAGLTAEKKAIIPTAVCVALCGGSSWLAGAFGFLLTAPEGA